MLINQNLEKSLDVIKQAFDQGLVTEEKYFEALEKAKTIEKRVHTSKKTGKKWLERHEVGSEDEIKIDYSSLLKYGQEHFNNLRLQYHANFPEEDVNMEENLNAEFKREFYGYGFCLNAAKENKVIYNSFEKFDKKASQIQKACYYNSIDYMLKFAENHKNIKLAYGFHFYKDDFKQLFQKHSENITRKDVEKLRANFGGTMHAFLVVDGDKIIDPTLKNPSDSYYFYDTVPANKIKDFKHELNDKNFDARDFEDFIIENVQKLSSDKKIQDSVIRIENQERNFTEDKILNSFLNKLAKKGTLKRSPLNSREFIYNDNAMLEFSRFDKKDRNEITLQDISVFNKSQGVGSKILKDITESADEDKIKLTLDAKPFGTDKKGLNKQQLINFYKKFGFETEVGQYGIDDIDEIEDYVLSEKDESLAMVREPKEKTTQNQSSNIINWFDAMLKMGFNDKQKEFYTWERNNAKQINIVSTDSIREKYPQIDDYLSNYAPIQKQCYMNASKMLMNVHGVPDLEYVEGMISFMGIPIEHAWNKIGNEYFDTTKDIALKDQDTSADEYVSLIELDQNTVHRYASETGTYGGFLKEKFLEDSGKSSSTNKKNKIEKAEKSFKIGDTQTWHGRQFKKTVSGWAHDDEKKSKLKEDKQNEKKLKIQDFSDEDLHSHAERASNADLQKIVQHGRNPKLREIAKHHLTKRKEKPNKEDQNSLYDLMILEDNDSEHHYSNDENTIHFDKEIDNHIAQKLNEHGIKYLIKSKEKTNNK